MLTLSSTKPTTSFTRCSSIFGAAQPLATSSSRRTSRARHAGAVLARASTDTKPEIAKVADSIGLPTDEGLFGFKPFPEVWVGRLAMMGFLTSVVEEFITGKGTLRQIGFETPSTPLFAFLLVFFGGLTAVASARTLYKATNKQMTATELVRYRQFLGIQKEDQNIAEEQAKLKQSFAAGTDVASPDNLKTIAAAKDAGTPADKVLGGTEPVQFSGKLEREPRDGGIFGANVEAEAAREAAAMKRREQAGMPAPSISLSAKQDILEQSSQVNSDFDYARNVELTNGRWAMIGFLTAIIIEAATGRGILVQLIGYAKALNLLGPASGVDL
ncbi:hypothetical protein COCSUDRAFT_63572 [Coccomyxa subellipsoidea C-169]|uniref:Uncharacterized protein n=1 Tax=Coccomyxa subellipsoidea (strain C-169) TaxID=574566 RepID=I0YXU6_COCSC|nr:hypothetical protein COCSUDRAFT_63572 [Coccomyxa subellipsoidea C-169]EIE23215.1 hypothetical protein COCSUDRAFT_63572 [Coccomyxa subellipsoidea C-169]|eukprot:XP_005647759.1 hypothetical protein COCSUDRAFT_63572 [Coccomyxa subellipsoidea C-169]